MADVELLTLKKAAKKLGIAKCTLYRWVERDWIGYVRMPNSTIRIPQTAIDIILTGSK